MQNCIKCINVWQSLKGSPPHPNTPKEQRICLRCEKICLFWQQCSLKWLTRVYLSEFLTTVSKKQNKSSCIETCVFSLIYPEPLELQKSYLHLFTSLIEELSDDFFFKYGHEISWYLEKRCFAKKVSYWEKTVILKNSKTFFHGSKV